MWLIYATLFVVCSSATANVDEQLKDLEGSLQEMESILLSEKMKDDVDPLKSAHDVKQRSCPIERGFCVKGNGGDQNSGVLKINSFDGNTDGRQKECLAACLANPSATGCEVIWTQGNRGCYIHTQEVARGNDADRHMCWIFSKCKTTQPVATVTDENNHWVYACQNKKATISCPANHIIIIAEASFGREDNERCPTSAFRAGQDCTTAMGSSAIERKCGYKQNCEILAEATSLGRGDTTYCQEVPKVASIKFSCQPIVAPQVLKTGSCSERLDINQCRQYASQIGRPISVNKDKPMPQGCSRKCEAQACAEPRVSFTEKVSEVPCGGSDEDCLCGQAQEEVPTLPPTEEPTEPVEPVKPVSTQAPGVVAVDLNCQETDMTATFDPDVLPGDILNVSVSNCADNNFQVSNGQTKVHVAFKDCANNITQSAKVITQENIVAVVNGVKETSNTVQRIVVYYYKLQCFFDRELHINYGNAIEIKDREESFEQARKTAFAAGMEMYTSPKFNQLSQSPYHVTAFAPIYMKIRGIHNNALFKFITQDCYATPTDDPEDKKQYLFFDDKCKLDQTFKELHHGTPNVFMFKVNAFTFIKMKKQVYFHCDLLICKHEAESEECTQKCGTEERRRRRRRRRDAGDNAGIETITVRSGQMTWDDSVYDRPLDQQLEAVKDELAEVIEQMKKH